MEFIITNSITFIFNLYMQIITSLLKFTNAFLPRKKASLQSMAVLDKILAMHSHVSNIFPHTFNNALVNLVCNCNFWLAELH